MPLKSRGGFTVKITLSHIAGKEWNSLLINYSEPDLKRNHYLIGGDL